MTAPEQVHIAMGSNYSQMVIAWVTEGPANSTVIFGKDKDNLTQTSTGNSSSYTRHQDQYTSGEIHSVMLKDLEPETTYFYQVGDVTEESRVFSFRTAPPVGPSVPYSFSVVGDLGQTQHSRDTIHHIEADPDVTDMVLIAGDLSYADGYQPRWDSWGRMMQHLASARPLMVSPGNHEEEVDKEHNFFQAFQARFFMPSESSNSTGGNLWYSFNVGPAHIVTLCSYSDWTPGSPQYEWLVADLQARDSSVTPWLIVVLHAPWYNSNTAHHDETEEYKMREHMEPILHKAGVDMVFAGHVHSYERSHRVFNYQVTEQGAPYYINVGAGGNRERLAKHYIDPQPDWSAIRKAEYGHGKLQIHNATHAHWQWLGNMDPQYIPTDDLWIVKSDGFETVMPAESVSEDPTPYDERFSYKAGPAPSHPNTAFSRD